MVQSDTSKEAQQTLINIYRQMTSAAKIRQIFNTYQFGKILAMAGLRQLHPKASEKQIWQLWAKQHLGEKLFDKVYGNKSE